MDLTRVPDYELDARTRKSLTYERSAQRPRSAAVGECADEVRAEPAAQRPLQRVVGLFMTIEL